jgi:hypothetical protein
MRSLDHKHQISSTRSICYDFGLVNVALLLQWLISGGCGRLWFDPTSESIDAVAAESIDAVAGDLSYYQTVKNDNPVGYWRLNDTGTIAADEMNQHPGVISGKCTHLPRGFLASDAAASMVRPFRGWRNVV